MKLLGKLRFVPLAIGILSIILGYYSSFILAKSPSQMLSEATVNRFSFYFNFGFILMLTGIVFILISAVLISVNKISKTDISKKRKVYYVISLTLNIILWIIFLPSIPFSLFSVMASDPFGTGMYTKAAESLIMKAIILCFYSPYIIFLSAISSLVSRLCKKYTLSLWLQFPAYAMFFAIILLFSLADYF